MTVDEAKVLKRVVDAMREGIRCPSCTYPTNEPFRCEMQRLKSGGIKCPWCRFAIYGEEIRAIEKVLQPSIDEALVEFHKWRVANGISEGILRAEEGF